MTRSIAAEFVISATDSVSFARLSGDYNPLHVDPVYARRTPFGNTVVHGIHLVLRSLDEVAGIGCFESMLPVECSVTFSNPVHTGSSVALQAHFDADTKRLRLTGSVEQRTAYSATVTFGPADDAGNAATVEHLPYPPTAPNFSGFPPKLSSGRVPIQMGDAQLREVLPALARLASKDWMADLLASTQLIGMQCPGMNSIYSGCKLKRGGQSAELEYRVLKVDERFKLLKLEMQGRYFHGSLEAFFRAPPVDQPALAEVCRHVPSQVYAGDHALVIGGSRGLGELTAKCVLAGGGRVTLTYARGREDAQRICDEARSMGRECEARPLDLAALVARDIPEWLEATPFTHVYYFASPRIAKSPDNVWDVGLFAHFTDAYVNAFASAVRAIAPGGTKRGSGVRFLYPSSIFVSQPEKGFAEYAAAKAAGEAMCEYLAQSYATKIQHPQLPRMRTDQTSGLAESKLQDPLPVILDAVRSMHANT